MRKFKRICATLILTPLNFIQKYFKSVVFIFIVILVISATSGTKDYNANLAKIYIKGAIFETESFMAQIENLRNYPNIRGILLIIDSPGGTLAASVEIADLVKELSESYPVVAYVQGTMASGSYYAGMYANSIVANRGSMIGSIGVILNGFNVENLLGKLGVESQILKAGEFKEAGTIVREWSEDEKIYLQNLLDKQYEMFVRDVAAARNLRVGDYRAFAEGQIFTAQDALELGLIDMVGTQINAINILREVSGVGEIVWVKQSAIEAYLGRFLSQAITQIFAHLMIVR